MSTLAYLATNQIIITRLTTVDGYKQAFATVTGCRANLQPVSPAKTELYGGAMGKTFRIFVDGAIDMREGDKLRDTSTQAIYKVANGGVTRRTHGIVDYKEVIVELVS